MKNVKKLVAFMLTLAMILSMGAVVFAQTETGSFTVTNPQTDITYNISKIFDVTYDEAKESYSYTIDPNSAWYATVAAYATTANGLTLTPVKNASNAVVKYNVEFTNAFSAPAFAKALMEAYTAGTVTPTLVELVDGTDANNNPVKTKTGLELGYWMLIPTGYKAADVDPVVASLDTTNADVVIIDKNEKPAVDKEIKDATVDEGKISNASVGDKIPYTLTTKVPDMTGYKKYFFVVHDTFSEGLSFNNDVKITLGGAELTAGTDYTVDIVKDATGKPTGEIRIIFKDMLKYMVADTQTGKNKVGEEIVITYSATLTEDAAIDDPNTNTAYVQFSNDPTYNPQYDPKDPPENPDDPKDPKNPNPPTGDGPNSTTETYTTELTINKVKEDGKTSLAGAKFKLTGEALNKVEITGENFVPYVEPAAGAAAPTKYFELKDGTYTDVDPTTAGNDVDKTVYVGYDATNPNYKPYMISTTKWYETKGTTPVSAEAFVDSTGKLVFTGLGEGTYTLTEVVTPDGYNPIDPITVTVVFNEGDAANNIKPFFYINEEAKDTDGDGDIDFTMSMNVVNTTGPILPSTGGIGTTIFYVLGGILLVGAAVLLITKKRMSASE